MGSVLPTKSTVTRKINEKAGQNTGAFLFSLPASMIGAASTNLRNLNYRQGLVDWYKYRKEPSALDVLDKEFGVNVIKGPKMPSVSEKIGYPLDTRYHTAHTKHGDILVGADKGNNKRMFFMEKPGSWSPFAEITSNPFVIRPHLDMSRRLALERIVELSPRGTYVVDSEIVPFGAQLRAANKFDFFKLLLTGPKQSQMSFTDAYEYAPNSYSSYKLALKQSARPGFDLRYTGQSMPRFNNNDFTTSEVAVPIDISLTQQPAEIIPELNNRFLTISGENPNYQPIKIVDNKVQIPVSSVLKK